MWRYFSAEILFFIYTLVEKARLDSMGSNFFYTHPSTQSMVSLYL
jgi:hypothetical protein